MGFIAVITALFAATVRMAAPLTLAGLGEACSERAGVLNIGVEAIMLSGAFFSFIAAFSTGNLMLGLLAGMAGGLAVSLIHALLSIRCRANQTIVGLALNFLILGLTSFLFLKAFGQTTTLPSVATFSKTPVPGLSKVPFLGQVLFAQDPLVYVMLLLTAGVWFLFYRTEWGINLLSVGENPRAADSAGLSVSKIRYLACGMNGILGGLAGAYLVLTQLGFFMENITAGKGYIVLVVVILGRRNPLGILGASLMIGFADALQFHLQTIGWPIPSQVFTMIPYVVTVLVLLFSVGKSSDPAALGIPYERNKR